MKFDWNRLQDLQVEVNEAGGAAKLRDLLTKAVDMLHELRNIHWNITKIETLLSEVATELDYAQMKFGPFKNAHEGYAVLLEEMDELWDEVKGQYGPKRTAAIRKEAMQVSAMALRIIHDVCQT